MSLVDPNYDVDWYRVPLSKEQLVAFNQRSNVWGFVGWWTSEFNHSHRSRLCLGQHEPGVVLADPPYCTCTAPYVHFAINAVHELVHGTVFASKWLNNFFAGAFAFIGWINHKAFWASHSEHHKYTLHDPHDREVVLPVTYHLKDFLNPSSWTHGESNGH